MPLAVRETRGVVDPPTASELLFERYLDVHGYVGERDVDWRRRYGVSTARDPDFLVSRAGEELAICEVKEFASSKLDRRLALQSFFSAGGDEVFGTAADAVQSAALEQLRPFAGVGLPLVVVLANPHGVMVPLAPRELVMSLLGTTEVAVVPVAPDAPAGPPAVERALTGRGALVARDANGVVHNPHPYLSAVVVVRERAEAQDFTEAELARLGPDQPPETAEDRQALMVMMIEALEQAEAEGRIPDGRYEFVEVLDLSAQPGFTGVSLPSNVFDGPRDRRMLLLPDGSLLAH